MRVPLRALNRRSTLRAELSTALPTTSGQPTSTDINHRANHPAGLVLMPTWRNRVTTVVRMRFWVKLYIPESLGEKLRQNGQPTLLTSILLLPMPDMAHRHRREGAPGRGHYAHYSHVLRLDPLSAWEQRKKALRPSVEFGSRRGQTSISADSRGGRAPELIWKVWDQHLYSCTYTLRKMQSRR